MAGEWHSYKIGELGKVITGKTPSTTEPENFGGPYPFITIPDLVQKVYIDTSERTLSEIGASKMKTLLLPPNSVMMSCIATIGKCGITTKPSFTNQQINSVICNPDIVDPLFLYYVFTQIGHQLESAGGGGSVYTNVSKSRFSEISVLLPPLPEQRTIAAVLGALDDKIELNRRMNRTLEAMAQAVFREMMKDVEKEGSILEFADLLSGGTPSTAEESYWNGDIEWVSAKDVSSADGVFLLDTEKKITQAGIDHSSTKLLPAKTTIVTARGTVGAHCMLGKPMTMNQTNYGLKAKEGIGDYFVYFALSEMVEQLKQQSYGTIFDTITTKTFHSVLCPRPSLGVIQQFEERVTPLMDAILNNLKQSRTLAALRDALLPKLLRGEVRVTVHE
jgi:type I restriction enzyme S subunit